LAVDAMIGAAPVRVTLSDRTAELPMPLRPTSAPSTHKPDT
jgi:hypothetical protein